MRNLEKSKLKKILCFLRQFGNSSIIVFNKLVPKAPKFFGPSGLGGGAIESRQGGLINLGLRRGVVPPPIPPLAPVLFLPHPLKLKKTSLKSKKTSKIPTT